MLGHEQVEQATSNRSPCASQLERLASASRSRAAPSPTAAVCATRMRRFVALSSTTSTDCARRGRPRPASAGWAPRRPAAAAGMRTARWKTLPSPATPVLSAVSEPSISSASRRLIARPRPVPP